MQHTYKRVSASDIDTSDGNVSAATTPLKMIGSIMMFSLAFAAITWSSYTLTSTVIANHSPPPSSTSSFSADNDVYNTFLEVSTAESPYEQHWPGSHLPDWAAKKINFNVRREQQICFTHVGKAGGSTVGCSLGFSLHCHSDEGGNGGDNDTVQTKHLSSSLLAKLSTHTFHKDVYNCDDDSGYFMLVIRDPIARALSAFNYDKPGDEDFRTDRQWANQKARFYYDCHFYHMEDFVQNGLREECETSDRCKRWARDAVQGTDTSDDSPGHWYYNYQYYFEAVPSDSTILVIRNEHIQEDIRSAEDLFECQEQERLELAKSMNTNTWSDPDDLYLSDESISILCQALCNEIQVYKKILHRALNISQDQLQVSLMELNAKCPDEAIAEECLDEMPNISEKIRYNRGY